MNDLVKFGGGSIPATTDDLVKGLQNVGQVIQGGTGGTPFLRLLKSGIYAYGPENIEPEEGSEWAANPFSVMHGFACWGDGELLDERMVPFNQAPPDRNTLPDYGYPWDQQVSMILQCMSGEDEGTAVLYKGTSTGLRNAVKELINEIIGQAQHDKAHIVPVLELDVDSYQHKRYGEIFYPVLRVARWVSFDGVEAAEPSTEAAPSGAEATAETIGSESMQKAAEGHELSGRRRRRAAETNETTENDGTQAPGGSNRRRRRRN